MFSFSRWLRNRAAARDIQRARPLIESVRERQRGWAARSHPQFLEQAAQLKQRARAGQPADELLIDTFAAVAEASWRVLELRPFDVQILAAAAMHDGDIAEMQTGEGKTLAAVFPACLNALAGQGFHVLTVNDYLARRDAEWMGGIYRLLGLTVSHIQQGLPLEDRRTAYAADVTYGTANEIGFDYLRDHLAREPSALVQRAFYFALIDEADSILIDEARIPLVIAGGSAPSGASPERMAYLARRLTQGWHYTRDEYSRNVHLTEAGARKAEAWLACGNLYDLENLGLLSTLNHALHAKELLRRNIDYIVKDGSVELVDEFKGRIVHDRRWPDGLQAAIEAKEGLRPKADGRVLATLTLQNLIDLYPHVAGMTATASTQAEELKQVYDLEVTTVAPNRANIRVDYEDVVFTHKAAKEAALIAEIGANHKKGRPILVGTASVEESERLGETLERSGIPNQILNARHDEAEARIIAQAGRLGAVTISTNMAGRGTDILLGGNPPQDREQVLSLGGLYVIGTNKHESRRIDNQLRGRAGRQGDPGSTCFFISLEDDLIQRFGILDLLPPAYRRFRSGDPVLDPAVSTEVNRAQRIIESQNLEIRRRLWRYEGMLEDQRRILHARRRAVLLGEAQSLLAERAPELFAELGGLAALVEKQITLARIDEFWSDHLIRATELREGIHWVSVAGHDPVHEFRKALIGMFDELLKELDDSIVKTFEESEITDQGVDLGQAGLLDTSSTWTYLINDQPMGDLSQRLFRGLAQQLRRNLVR